MLRLRIVIDPLNEPDSYTIRWEANATLHLPGASDLYLSVMDALYAINPATLFMIQVRLTMRQGLAYLLTQSVPACTERQPEFQARSGSSAHTNCSCLQGVPSLDSRQGLAPPLTCIAPACSKR